MALVLLVLVWVLLLVLVLGLLEAKRCFKTVNLGLVLVSRVCVGQIFGKKMQRVNAR